MSLQKQASLSNLASSPSGPPLSVGQCIEILKKGGALLKCGRKGDPHFRKFRVTEDLKVLSWESPNKKSKEATVTLSEVTEIRLGQKTKVFSNNKVPEYEHISFSLLYGERSLDLVCKDKREFDIWVAGLKALTVEPALFALSARSSVNEMRTSVNGLPRSDSLDVVVRGKSTVIVKYEEGSDVYSWGQGTNGRLGHGDEGDQLAPKVIEALLGKDVRAAACGSAHSIAVTAHGDVYTWGAGAYGRLGHGHERDRFTPLQVSALRGKMIIMVAAGDMHTLALAENGEVHVWGRGADGRLGLGDDQSNQLIPRQIEVLDDKRICFIAAGYKTSAAVSLEGDLYTWGGNDKGQLGHGDLATGTTPNPITSLKGVITQVQLASWHSAAVDIDGNVYTWGDGSNGKLGHGDEAEQLMPKKVIALNGQKVVQIACGDFHTAVLIDSGAVFTWGEGNYGQLGHGPAVSQYSKPLQVGKPLDGNKVTQIAAGSNITAALTSNGLVYTWGYATNGRLGHGDEDDQQIPRLVESMKGKSVQQISCGGAHMLATVTHGWVPDQESPQCMACKTMFTFVRRRHHCRNCGGIFCGSCSAKRFPILKTGSHEPVRVCDKCYSTLSSVK